VITVWAGPRTEWFEADALDHLAAVVWTVSGGVSRVGVRLDGPALPRRVGSELPSEGLVPGAIQVPPDGRPVVMSANHPTTGGYPVIAVVDPGHLTAVVQAPPGSAVRFRVVGR
jgi:allophanate hydrolase subunit 2